MIVIKPSNGDGGVSITNPVLSFDAVYQDSGVTHAQIEFNSSGIVAGTPTTVSGPSGWTWLNSGTAGDYEIFCQPTSGSVWGGSTDVNKWKRLNETRFWRRRGDAGQNVTMILTIRDVATQTTQATCTITLQDD